MKVKVLTLYPHELAAIRSVPLAEIFREIRTGTLPYSLDHNGDLIVSITYTWNDPDAP